MTQKHQLSANKRDLNVKGKVYRQDGFILANVFGEGDSQALILPLKDTLKLLSEVSESTVFYLNVDGAKEIPVMISEVQKDPLTEKVIHLALRKVNLKEKVTAAIPITTIGDFSVPDAVFLLVKDEVEAEALPTDLPEEFVVDVSKFAAIGEQFTFADLDYDRSKVVLDIESDEEPIVVVNEVKEEVEEVAPAEGEGVEGAESTAEAGDAASGEGEAQGE